MSHPMVDQTDKDDGMLEEEFERLQNQLRLVQNERQRQANEATVKLNKYRYELGLLNKENEELHLWIELMNSDQNKRKDEQIIKELRRILDEQDAIQEKIDDAREENEKLDIEIKSLEKRIREKQQEYSEQRKMSKNTGELLAKLEEKNLMMEKHLQAKNNKFCATLKENEKLRSDIDDMRLERRSFLELQKKLRAQLEKTNKLKAHVTSKAIAVYEQRQEAVNRKNVLKERNERERAAFESEMKNLQRFIDHNTQLEKFMNAKADERMKWKKHAEETTFKQGSYGEAAQKEKLQHLENYDATDKLLQKITGSRDMEGMIRVYHRREEDNFAQFKYVSELQTQIESLQDSIRSIEENTEQCRNEKERREKNKQAVMHEFEVRMNNDKSVADVEEVRLAQIRKVLDQVKSQIKSIVTKLGCDVSKIVQAMDAEGEEITERNLVLYLAALEQRVDELLCIRSYTLSKTSESEDGGSQPSTTEAYQDLSDSQAAPKTQIISLPSVADVEEEYDTESTSTSSVRPLTHAELISRVKLDLRKTIVQSPQTRKSVRVEG